MVGKGVHRVDERGQGSADVLRALSAARARRSRVLRPPRAGDTSGPSGNGAGLRYRGILLLALLVRGAKAPRAPIHGGAQVGGAQVSLLSSLGESDVVGNLAWISG